MKLDYSRELQKAYEKSVKKNPRNLDHSKPLQRALDKAKKPFQVSKEYHGGKWQKVGFFEGKKGVTVKPWPERVGKKYLDSVAKRVGNK
jgi:hypothetical protein